ncbi:unannotated protein [freshwater metagenome]|uniref:Unannotated protein n=1 Tax=freshwater metagenome TaxID=449393 RepID=A0A6J6QTA2_9ZZZZ
MGPILTVVVKRNTVLPGRKYCTQCSHGVSHSLNRVVKLFAESSLDMRANLCAESKSESVLRELLKVPSGVGHMHSVSRKRYGYVTHER